MNFKIFRKISTDERVQHDFHVTCVSTNLIFFMAFLRVRTPD